MSDLTRKLERAELGDSKAAEELLPLVYGELRRLAAHPMNGESPGHTLQPTSLVHEAWRRRRGAGCHCNRNRLGTQLGYSPGNAVSNNPAEFQRLVYTSH